MARGVPVVREVPGRGENKRCSTLTGRR